MEIGRSSSSSNPELNAGDTPEVNPPPVIATRTSASSSEEVDLPAPSRPKKNSKERERSNSGSPKGRGSRQSSTKNPQSSPRRRGHRPSKQLFVSPVGHARSSKNDEDAELDHYDMAIVTGASSGLGFETTLALAKAGYRVILGCRSESKATTAIQRIKYEYNYAEVCYFQLDISNLESIRKFVAHIESEPELTSLSILVNNAGIAAIPKRETTEDGLFELQFATNYLGHYYLTSLLLPLLKKSKELNPRVVTVSSKTADKNSAKINFDDLQLEKNYKPWLAYYQSKLANLLFHFELQRLSKLNNWGITCIAVHPGFARTQLFKNGPGQNSCFGCLTESCLSRPFSQSAAEGAECILFAATDIHAEDGGYYGPQSCFQCFGDVGPVKVPKRALDETVAKKLWDVSAQLTGAAWE